MNAIELYEQRITKRYEAAVSAINTLTGPSAHAYAEIERQLATSQIASIFVLSEKLARDHFNLTPKQQEDLADLLRAQGFLAEPLYACEWKYARLCVSIDTAFAKAALHLRNAKKNTPGAHE